MKKVATIVYVFISMLIFSASVFGQKIRVEGMVIDQETSNPLWGASVLLKATQKGVATDSKGYFVFSGLLKDQELIIRFVGYEEQTLKVSEKFQKIALKKSSFLNDEVFVKATRADENSGMVFSNTGSKELAKSNLGQDMPVLLQFTPSVVMTSDAGAGIGYTGIRIRGSDATRVNVTINGIPVNDSESQGSYWINMPDFASSVSSVQIQRGVGTSTNGAGAFGGSVNIQTNQFEKDAYGELNASAGSFNTLKTTLKFGTGLMKGKFTLDGRVSKIVSDGYIDRAYSDLKSAYVSGAYFGKKSLYRFNYFTGKEKTFQSWYGTPESRVKNDLNGMKAYIERNGLNEAEAANLLTSGRTYNYYTYANQTDNYAQDHYQLLTHHTLSGRWDVDANLHYTYGRGYFEEFKPKAELSKYDLKPFIRNGVLVDVVDIVRRKWLDNDFFGTTFALNYLGEKGLKWTFGGAWNQYLGRHFGEVVGGDNLPSTYLGHRWYESKSNKTDLNFYNKLNVSINDRWLAYADLQLRFVGYDMRGIAEKLQDITQNWKYQFFNPKVGLTRIINEQGKLYASWSVGSREPSRQDFIDNPGKTPKPEYLSDFEMGYLRQTSKYSFQLNAYSMNYQDQLVLTGAVNNVGEAIRKNVPTSNRMGIEASLNYSLSSVINWQINGTFSRNKIKNFEETIPNYDTNGEDIVKHGETDIAYSPNVIVGNQFSYIWRGLETSLLTKYVGKQYLNNTSDDTKVLSAYLTQDIRFNYTFKSKWAKNVQANLLLNNVFNTLYSSNGYTYSYVSKENVISENFYYPQAGFNFLLGVVIRI
jgi:iron complex outermembrane receptor protein